MRSNEIKKGVIISYIQIAINIVVGLCYTPIMIKLLGKSEYGLYNTVASTISTISILNLGFNAGYVRYFSQYKKECDDLSIHKLNGLFLILFIILGVIAGACGLFLSFHLELVFDMGLTESELEIAKILMIMLTVNMAESFPASVFSTIISANERFIFLKLMGIIKALASPFISLPLLLAGQGAIAMVMVMVIVSVSIDCSYMLYVLLVLKDKFEFKNLEKRLFFDLAGYTTFIAINLIVDQINWNIDKVLLGRFKGTSSVAVYSVGYTLFNCYMVFSSSLSGIFTPRIHRIVAQAGKDTKQLRKNLTVLFVKIGRIQFLLLALIASGFVFFGRKFIDIWAGTGYEEAYFVALLLIIPGSIALIQNMGIEMQRAQNLHRFRSIVYLFMAIVNLGISIVLCQLYGAIGSAIGTAISLIVANGFIMNIYYYKKCNIDVIIFWKNICLMMRGLLLPLIVGIMWVLFIGNKTTIALLVGIIIYSCIYTVSVYFLSMNSEEKELVQQTTQKVLRKSYK